MWSRCWDETWAGPARTGLVWGEEWDTRKKGHVRREERNRVGPGERDVASLAGRTEECALRSLSMWEGVCGNGGRGCGTEGAGPKDLGGV